MAVTKIHAIKRTLKKALDYIENPNKTEIRYIDHGVNDAMDYIEDPLKTEEGYLVSAYNVDPLVASIEFELTAALAREVQGKKFNAKTENIAYHLIQSFDPGDDVTPEKIHAIGWKLAREFTGGQHEFVVSTHVDKGHLHNHIIINATNFYTLKKMQTKPFKTVAEIRNISDRLCAENELSVIKEFSGLGRSYKENMERKANNSWKSEIRKKLNFVLEQATNYDEFKAAAAELGVTVDDSGKHIKYQVTGQERWTRGNKLSAENVFLPDGIKDRLDSNREAQNFLKEAIKDVAKQAGNYDEFKALMEQKSIKISQEKSGNIVYHLDDMDVTMKERVLGQAFSTESIKAAISQKNFDFKGAENGPDLMEEYNKTVSNKVPESEIRVLLSADQIDKVTVDGILLNVVDRNENLGKVFIDSGHINYLKDSNSYEIFVGRKFDYHFTMDTINPDLFESDQLTNRFIKGENLIRNLELVNGIEPQKIEISPADIRSVSEKGVTLSMPDLGVESLFIPAEFAELDRSGGGSCRVNLYQNWGYNFKSTDPGEQKYQKTVTGKELIDALQGRDLVQNQSLAGKIQYAMRKSSESGVHQLESVLLTMRREGIDNLDGFDKKISELQGKVGELRGVIGEAESKNATFKTAAKYLLAYKTNLPYKQEVAEASVLTRSKLEKKYEGELRMFDHAASQLEKMGLSTDVDPEKVKVMIKEQDGKIEEVNKMYVEIKAKIDEIKKAQDIAKRVQGVEPTKEQPQKPKSRDDLDR